MGNDNVKLHSRQNLGEGQIYNYRFDATNGMDVRLLNRQGDSHKVALIRNMIRNKKSAAEYLEPFGGYARILSSFSTDGKLNGVYTHRFEDGEYLILHVGSGLYTFSHARRYVELLPRYLIAAADAPSVGVSLGSSFYLLDGENLYEISSPDTALRCGDEPYTDEMEEYNRLPATRAYIPLAYRGGKRAEAKNLLTAYYDLEDETSDDRRVYDDYGLKLRAVYEEGQEALEVYGIEEGRRTLFIPEEADFYGKRLPIVGIAPAAFAYSPITVAVVSKNVRRVSGSEEEPGAFAYCNLLKRAVFFGLRELGERAFDHCGSLCEIAFSEDITAIAENAFDGASSLARIYYGGAVYNPDIYLFGEEIKVYADTFFKTAGVDEEIRFSADPDLYMKVYGISEASRKAIGTLRRYGGWSDGVMNDDVGYSTETKKPIALCGLCFESHLDEVDDRYAFLTVVGNAPMFEAWEEPTAVYDIPIPDDCRTVVSTYLDGDAAKGKSIFGYREGKSYLKALRFTFPCAEKKKVSLRIYSKGRDLGKLSSLYPAYGGVMSDTVKAMQAAAVSRDRLYLSGHPALPGAVLRSALPERGGEGLYFPEDLVSTVTARAVTGLLPCKDRMAVMTDREIVYLESGVIAEDIEAFCALAYRDCRYFLLSDGVYRLDEGVSVSYTHLKKLSVPIEGEISSFQSGKLCIWQGYLVLLLGNIAYLADLDRPYRENGETLYPWYSLSTLGDRSNAPFVGVKSLEDSLYFFTDGGRVYLSDEGTADGTFDSREIECLIVGENADFDCRYLYKKLYRKSMVLHCPALEGGEVTVSLSVDEKEPVSLGSFVTDGDPLTVRAYTGRFLRGTVSLRGRFAFDGLAFRYTVMKRQVR